MAALGVGGVAQAQDPGATPQRTAADDVFGGTPEIPTVIRGSGLMLMPMGTIDDLTLVVGEPPHEEEVADKFKSSYPNLVRYTAVSSNMAAATVSVSGSVVTVTPVAPGMTTVTVTASNGANSAEQEFAVTVRNPNLDVPRRVGRLYDVTLVKGQTPHAVEAEDAFSGDLLMYSAVSSNPGVATVSTSGSVVTVTPIAVGMTTVTVTALNGGGDADQTFKVTVRERVAPSAVGSLDDLELLVGQPAHPVEVADAFAGDDLTYTAASSSPGVAVVTTSGSVVSVRPLSVGMTTVTVTAQNELGTATQTFDVDVRNPNAPQAVGSLDDITLALGQPPHDVEVAGAFMGTNLTFAAVSSDRSVTVTVTGAVVTLTPASVGTVTVTARNSAGEAAQTFTVTVTADAAELELIDDILAAMARNTLASVRGAITGRFRSAPGRTPGAAARSAAGAALGLSTFRGGAGADPGGLTAGSVFGAVGQAGPAGVSRGAPLGAPAAGGAGGAGTSRLDPLLWGNDFVLPFGGGGAAAQADGEAVSPTAAVWGSTDMQWFRGTPEAGRYDGAVKSVYLGVDGRVSDAWTGGLTVALTRASGEGSLHTSLNSLYPYVRWTSAAGDEVWGAFGGGVGNARHTRTGAASTSASYRLLLGTAGWRRGLVRGDGLRVSTVGDLGIVHLKTQGAAGPLARRRLSVQQVRAGVEAEYAGRQMRPFVQASGRVDGGAGQTGAGIEVAGGVRYGLSSGWAIEALARTMALHSADGYREHGASVTARYAASPEGLGLSLALSPRWGAGAQGGGVEALWRDQALQRTVYGVPARQAALDGTVGYGIAAPRLGGLLTAFGEFDVGAGQSARSGIRLNLAERALEALDMEVSAARQNFPGFDADNRIDVLGRLSF